MKSRKPFDQMDEDEYLFGKLTNDGGYINQFYEEQHLPSKKRLKIPEERVDIAVSSLEVGKKKSSKDISEAEEMEGYFIPIEGAEIAQNCSEKCSVEEVVEPMKCGENTVNKTVKMTLRELFNHYYDAYANLKWKGRWSKMMQHFRPYIPDEKQRREFLQKHFKRKRHNESARKRRSNRKMSINGFNYFVTFTYSDEKMTADEFERKLKSYLKNKVQRSGWKYIGAWEGLDGSVRLHFHALMFIPDDVLPGENFVETKYNPKTKQMETHTRNTEFNEKFGLSTIEEIIPEMKNHAYDYITKYMDKGGKMMVSRNCPTFIKCAVQKKYLVGSTNEDETSFLMAADAEVVMETGEVVKLEPEKLYKILPDATTCN